MKNLLADKISLSIDERLADSDGDSFESITFRPDQNIGAMIHALNVLLLQPVSTLFVDEISHTLARLILESKDNNELIQEFLDETPQPGSAMEILLKKMAIWLYREPVQFTIEDD